MMKTPPPSSRQACRAIRDRVYPRDVWPRTLLERSIQTLGSKNAVLLEIGCGRDATFLRRVCAHYGRSVGLDFEIAAQAELGSGRLLLRGDGHHIPLRSQSVDVVVSADVAEHLADPEAFLLECRRVLKPGGHVLTATVNKYFPPIIVARWMPHWLRKIVNRIATGTNEEDTFPVFYRANSPGALRRHAERAGLDPVWVRHVSHHPVYFMFSAVAYRVAVCFDRVVRRYDRLGFLRHMIHACFRNPESAASTKPQPSDQGGLPAQSVG